MGKGEQFITTPFLMMLVEVAVESRLSLASMVGSCGLSAEVGLD